MYVLQSNIHWTHGNGDILEAGEKVKKVMGSKSKLRRLDTLRSELEGSEGQGRSEGG